MPRESRYTPSLAGLCSFEVPQPRKQLQNKQKYPRKLSRSLGYNYKTIQFPNENEKDIHGDFGANCYAGFRHSLCHGWSCGVIAFLAENVLGIKIKKAGYVAISVNPFQDNEYSKGAIPTPFGEIIIEKGGKEKPLELTTPKEINIIS